MSSTGNPSAYELHLFGLFGASQKVTKIGRNVYPLLDAVSQKGQRSKPGVSNLTNIYARFGCSKSINIKARSMLAKGNKAKINPLHTAWLMPISKSLDSKVSRKDI